MKKMVKLWLASVAALLQTKTTRADDQCDQTQIFPLQVGGATGDTELIAIDEYANKVLTVHWSFSLDMIDNDVAGSVPCEQLPISLLHVTDFDVLAEDDYLDGATKMVAVISQITTAVFEVEGTGIVTLTGELNPTLSYLNSDLDTVTSTKIQLTNAPSTPFETGPGSVFAINEGDKNHVFLVLSQSEMVILSESEFMESRLIHLTRSSASPDFRIEKISVLSPRDDLINGDLPLLDPITTISGFTFFTEIQLCDYSTQYGIAYWTSYPDSLKVNDETNVQEYYQMSCLEIYCSISVFGQPQSTKSICFEEQTSYHYARNKRESAELELLSFKRQPNSVIKLYNGDICSVGQPSLANGGSFTLTFISTDYYQGTIYADVDIYTITSWGNEIRPGNHIVYNSASIFFSVIEPVGDNSYTISVMELLLSNPFSIYFQASKKQVSNVFSTTLPATFSFTKGQNTFAGFGTTTSSLDSYIDQDQDSVTFNHLQSFFFVVDILEDEDGTDFTCQQLNWSKPPSWNGARYGPEYIEYQSSSLNPITDISSQIEQSDELVELQPESGQSYTATSNTTPTLPKSECEEPYFEAVQRVENLATVDRFLDNVMFYKVPLVPLSLCSLRLCSFTFQLQEDPFGARRRLESHDSVYYEESEEDNMVYLYVQTDAGTHGSPSLTIGFTIVYSNGYEFEAKVEIDRCDISAHSLEIPTSLSFIDDSSGLEELEFPFLATFDGSSGDLMVGFKFRPEVYMDPTSLMATCGYTWKNLPIEFNVDENTEIFENFDVSFEVVTVESQVAASGGDTSDYYEHIIVAFEATVSQVWAMANKDTYPVVLDLLFSQTQLIEGLSRTAEYALETFVTIELDYACLFSVELWAPFDSADIVEFTKDMVMTSFPIEQVTLPGFEVSPLDCSESFSIDRQVTVVDSDGVDLLMSSTPWLTQTVCCLEIDLNKYQTFDFGEAGDSEITTIYNVTVFGSVDPYPGQQQTSSYSRLISIREVPLQPLQFSSSLPKPVYTTGYGEEIRIDVPQISSQLPYTVSLTVDAVEIPFDECVACPIYLEQISQTQFVIVALIADPLTKEVDIGEDEDRGEDEEEGKGEGEDIGEGKGEDRGEDEEEGKGEGIDQGDDATGQIDDGTGTDQLAAATKSSQEDLSYVLEVSVVDTQDRKIQIEFILELGTSQDEPQEEEDKGGLNTNSTIVDEPKDISVRIEGADSSDSNKFSTTTVIQSDYIASIWKAQETKMKKKRKRKQDKLEVLPRAPKMMSKEGSVKILFESAIVVPSEEEIARLKTEDLISLKLIPSDATVEVLEPTSLEYDWKVVDVTKQFMEIKVDFTYPLNISMVGDYENLMISFNRVSEVLKQAQADVFEAIPENYIIFVAIPPQKGEIQSFAQIPIDTEEVSQQMIMGVTITGLSTVIGQFYFTYALQTCLSMIHGIQVASHLPLNKVTIPANAQIFFTELLKIASFDIYEPAEHYDFEFSETDAYNERFEQLGYQSMNVAENMGSIIFLFCFVILKIILTFLVTVAGCSNKCCFSCARRLPCCRPICRSKSCTLLFNQQVNTNLAIQFMYTTCLEIMICTYIGLSLMDFLEESESKPLFGDKAANILNYVILGMLIVFLGILIAFTFCKSQVLHREAKEEIKYRYDDYVKSEVKYALSRKLGSSLNGTELRSEEKTNGATSSAITILQVKEMNEMLNGSKHELTKIQKRDFRHVRRQKQLLKSRFGFYEVFYSNLRMQSSGARFYSLTFVTRRLILVVVVFNVDAQPWLQMTNFVFFCLIKLVYLVTSRPLADSTSASIEIFNEIVLMFTGYLFLALTGITNSPIQVIAAGDIIIVACLIIVLLDLGMVIYSLIKGLILTCKNQVYRDWLIRRQINANYAYNKNSWNTRKLRKLYESDWDAKSKQDENSSDEVQVQCSIEDSKDKFSSESSSPKSNRGSSIDDFRPAKDLPFATIKEERSMEDAQSDWLSERAPYRDSKSSFSSGQVVSKHVVSVNAISRLSLSEDSVDDSFKSYGEVESPPASKVAFGMSQIILDRKPVVKKDTISNPAPQAQKSSRELKFASNLQVLVDGQSGFSQTSGQASRIEINQQPGRLRDLSGGRHEADLSARHSKSLSPSKRSPRNVFFERMKFKGIELQIQNSTSSKVQLRDQRLPTGMNKGIQLPVPMVKEVPIASRFESMIEANVPSATSQGRSNSLGLYDRRSDTC